MPWKECSVVSSRREFVMAATQEGANISRLCRRFGISRDVGYKWIGRYKAEGMSGLLDRSRRPRHSPSRTGEAVERTVISLRKKHPAWGGRKLRRRLQDLGHKSVPSASTITEILRRHGMLDGKESSKHRAFIRFEHPAPNDLWQMDFKGDFPLTTKGRCYPLTILDDHSRFAIALRACTNQRTKTVRGQLTSVFRRYGLPRRILTDNGSPWGSDSAHRYTPLVAWLMRLGIGVTHARPYHPQTQGKEERFHRTLQAEVIRYYSFVDIQACQRRFDPWREVYNLERPHEALDMETPATRYRESDREFPEVLPRIEYGPEHTIRKVDARGGIRIDGSVCKISKAFRGYAIGLRPTSKDGCYAVYFCEQHIGNLDVRGAGKMATFVLPNSVRYAHYVRQNKGSGY